MINLDELKPILSELLDAREDGADYIERVTALDKPVEVDRSEIDELNASWNERFKRAFFGEEKAETIDERIPEGEEVKEERDEDYDGEDLKYEDLFEKVEKKEED